MNRIAWGILITVAVIFCSNGYVAASGWEEIWRNLSQGKSIQPGVAQSATIYGANADFTLYDGDKVPDNFSDEDRIDMIVRSATSKEELRFSGTKPQLVEWAKANSNTLLRIIFPSSPEASFGGPTAGQFATQQIMLASYGTLSTVRNVDIQVSEQYDFFELGPKNIEAKGSSGMMSFDWDLRDGKHNLGFIMPYRYIKSDDELDSKMGYLSLIPAYKYRHNIGKSRLE